MCPIGTYILVMNDTIERIEKCMCRADISKDIYSDYASNRVLLRRLDQEYIGVTFSTKMNIYLVISKIYITPYAIWNRILSQRCFRIYLVPCLALLGRILKNIQECICDSIACLVNIYFYNFENIYLG
jgi:hypothetical protein